jgi:hypothetical protein
MIDSSHKKPEKVKQPKGSNNVGKEISFMPATKYNPEKHSEFCARMKK